MDLFLPRNYILHQAFWYKLEIVNITNISWYDMIYIIWYKYEIFNFFIWWWSSLKTIKMWAIPFCEVNDNFYFIADGKHYKAKLLSSIQFWTRFIPTIHEYLFKPVSIYRGTTLRCFSCPTKQFSLMWPLEIRRSYCTT